MSRQHKKGVDAGKPSGEASASSKSWPVEIVKHYTDEAVFYLINLLTILLFFPFAWRSTIPEIIVVGLGAWCYFRFLKPHRAARSSSARLAYAASLGACVLGFVAVWPFIVAPKPVYIVVQKRLDPTESRMDLLQSGGKTVGCVVTVTDPARKALLSLLGLHLPSYIRVLEESYCASGSFYKFPIMEHFLFDARSSGDVTWQRSLYFPLNIAAQTAEVYPPEANLLKLDGIGLDFPPKSAEVRFVFAGRFESDLLNFGYTQYPDTVPWNAVHIQPQVEGAMERYAAFLAISIECFAEGRTEEAMRALEGAAAEVPSSNLEAARVAALQYLVARDRLYGNIGELQSLPLLHNAYDLFLLSKTDPRFSGRDPLTNWLRQTLLTGYDRWSWAFFDRISELWTIPHLDDKADSHFEALKRRLGPMSWRELMQFVGAEQLSLGELCFVKAHVTGKIISTILTKAKPFLAADQSAVMLGGLGVISDRTTVKECAAEWAEISSNALPLIESIDCRLSRYGVLQADPVWAQTLRSLRDELPRVLDHWNDEGDEFFRGLLKSYPRSRELRSLYAFAKVLESNGSSGNAEKGMANEWWKEDYFLWFVSWSKDAIIEIEKFKHPERKDLAPVGNDVRGEVARLGFDAFTKDRGGRGRTFLPGLACLAWYAETFELKGREVLSQEFEAKTKMSLQQYITTLESGKATPLVW